MQTITVLPEMPDWLDNRHAELHVAARQCYELRNQADHDGDPLLAADFHAVGDSYLQSALALTGEWAI
jgi:hypothetical protein